MVSSISVTVTVAVVGVIMTIAVLRFMRRFYEDPARSVQLIRLGKNSISAFVLLLSMNFVFFVGYLFQFLGVSDMSDVFAVLVYALGAAAFLFILTGILSKRYLV